MRSPFLFSSALYWPHCSGLEAVVRGGGQYGSAGLQAASPSSLRDSHHPPD